ncbi:MAG: mechanosensitive ion channel family protein [Verrucomicrobiales bacterium]|nr:mechanosensitive ion channel family protein [Verrucomicrobiales bacterium]
MRWLIVFLSLFLGSLAWAEPVDLEAMATQPETPSDQLDIALKPMTKAQLEKVAATWQGLLETKAREIATTQIELQGATDNATRGPLQQQLDQLQLSKTTILDRFDHVLSALEERQGDVTDYRRYAAAQGGITLTANDARTAWTTLRSWLKADEGGMKWAILVGKFLGVFLLFWIAAVIAGKTIHEVTRRQHHLSGLMKRFIDKMARRAILFVGLLVALATVGVNLGALVALVGGGAFILGFALQDTLSNFANGIMLLIYRPFDVGDAVEINGISGNVEAVSLVSTTLCSFDNKIILVPNKEVWGQTIINMTGNRERRVDLMFGIGYDDDADAAMAILRNLTAAHPAVLKEPATVIRMHELGDSSVNLICRPWTKTADYWTVHWDLTEQVKKAFDEAGIEFPFPQRDVHLYHAETSDSAGEKPDAKAAATLAPPATPAGYTEDEAEV